MLIVAIDTNIVNFLCLASSVFFIETHGKLLFLYFEKKIMKKKSGIHFLNILFHLIIYFKKEMFGSNKL